MKKKYLSLVMAAMMSLGAVVQANAAPLSTQEGDYSTVEWDATKDKTVNVDITGSVERADGTAAAGKLKVELPTKMAFAVDKGGTFNGTSYTVKNQSDSAIKISVASFNKGNGRITLHAKGNDISEEDRSNITLYLEGSNLDGGSLEVDLGSFDSKGTNEILEVESTGTSIITLNGSAGQEILSEEDRGDSSHDDHVDNTGASDTFNMVFKIEKKNA